MEDSSSKNMQDDNETSTKDEVAASFQPKVDMGDDVSNCQRYQEGIPGNRVYFEGGRNVSQDSAPADVDSAGEVNMEASISPDDVMRAGGLGARDDINTLLPVAIDMTDFEATLRDARDYEDSPEKTSRPGLGWHGTK